MSEEKETKAPVDKAVDKTDISAYPMLSKYTSKIKYPQRPILGRDRELKLLKGTMERPELSNAILLAPPGVGKTTIVEALVRDDPSRLYLKVDLPAMSASSGNIDGTIQMAPRMSRMVEEVGEYQRATGADLILFIDEFHLLPQLSYAASQAIKPILAESGRSKIRIVAATTYEEYEQYVKKDLAFEQRLQRISVSELQDDVVFGILKSMTDENIPDVIVPDDLLKEIVSITNRYLPSDAQPRKAIRLLDSMIGWYRAYEGDFDHRLMAEMFKIQTGVDIDFDIDVEHIESYLNKRVINQRLAVETLTKYLYISLADLNDPTRPRGSFLFTGSTGVGKTEMAKAFTKAVFGSEEHMIRFDMSEYSNPEYVPELQKRLSNAIWQNPFTTLLFDEVEKSSRPAVQLLLQVLDDARLSDEYGREVSFKNCYIVMTTNVGQHVYKELAAHVSDSHDIKNFEGAIKRALIDDRSGGSQSIFTPEFINRLDAFIPFTPLDDDSLSSITLLRLKQLTKQVYNKHGVTLHFDQRVLEFLSKENMEQGTNNGGGRVIHRRIYSDVLAPVSKMIKLYPYEDTFTIYVEGDMAIERQDIAKSDAHIVVARYKD